MIIDVRPRLVHASPRYYDPVKAHEYYLKTRELKGRKDAIKGVGLSEKQKEAFDYSKSKIAEAQTVDEQALAKAQEESVAALKQAVQDKATEIRDKLKGVLDEAAQNLLQDEFDNFVEDVKAKIQAAKENYETLKDALKKKYEDETISEYDAIKATVDSKPKANSPSKSGKNATRSARPTRKSKTPIGVADQRRNTKNESRF